MRSLRFLAVLLALGIFGISSPRAYACECVGPSEPSWELAHSDAVFAGRVLGIQPTSHGPIDSGLDPLLVTFQVSRVWKGNRVQQLQVATASGGEPSCGFEFQQGQEYIVYARQENAQLTTGLCTRTNLLREAGQDLAALGQGQVVTPPAAQNSFPFAQALVVGIVLLVVVGLGAGAFLVNRPARKDQT